jgi:hypothetical protein
MNLSEVKTALLVFFCFNAIVAGIAAGSIVLGAKNNQEGLEILAKIIIWRN